MVIEEDPVSPSTDPRGQHRASILLAAVLRAGADQAPAKVRDMSPNGAMIESPITPSIGSKIELMRGALVAHGTVIWSAANRCGVRFSSEVSVKDWLAAPTKVQQQRVDEIVAFVKAGGGGQRLEDLAADVSRTHEQLIDDLGAIMRLMQNLEDDLRSSDATLERHGMKLQNLDIAMQMLRAVAAELAPDSGSRPQSIAKLRDLRVACAQALGKG